MKVKHEVKINVSDKSGRKHEVLRSGYARLPKRLARRMAGNSCGIFVLTPGASVEGIEIREKRRDDDD